MTIWKDIKKSFEDAGVKDEDDILYIDISFMENITFELDKDSSPAMTEAKKCWRIWS